MLTERKEVMENTETAPEGHWFVVSQLGVWGAGKTQAEALKNADKYGKLTGLLLLEVYHDQVAPKIIPIENGYVPLCQLEQKDIIREKNCQYCNAFNRWD